MNSTPGKFSAVDPALGYLFQVRCALLWSLRGLRSGNDFLIGVETLDDVAFETAGGVPTELLQTKHHQAGKASLTNASCDLWKTLRIWFEGYATNEIPGSSKLCLLTTSEAPAGSAASFIRSSNRDPGRAHAMLLQVAKTSHSQANQDAYSAFLSASELTQQALIGKVVVLDSSSNISDIGEDLRQEVFWAAGRNNLTQFLDRLEGWWFRRVLLQLTNKEGVRIGSVELDSQMSDLRDQFKQESLPIDEDLLGFSLDDATRVAHVDSVFVKQVELVTSNGTRISSAIRDYYRAYEQRSRWVRDDLVVGLELKQYEKNLIEEWELTFEAMRDDLGEDATDKMKQVAARSVLVWAEQVTIPIRPLVTEPFLTRGSLHMLSDNGRIGWHPEFVQKLSEIFGITV